MGKDWDTFNEIRKSLGDHSNIEFLNKMPRQSIRSMQEFFVPIWKECLRVLKPGAFAFIMCIPRQDCLARMIVSLQDAGFETNFTSLYWAYACLSQDTEVLTKDGWKDWERLRKSGKDVKIVVYDTVSRTFKWEVPIRWNYYQVEDTCYRIKSDYTDQLVSRGHRIAIERKGEILFRTPQEAERERVETILVPYLETVPVLWENISTLADALDKRRKLRELLQYKMSPKNEYQKVFISQRQACSSDVRSTKATTTRSYAWGKELGLERWSNLFQNTWQLCRNKVCSLSERVFGYGSERRLCYGASAIGGSTVRQTAVANGNSAPQRPRPNKQLTGQFGVISKQPFPQVDRRGGTYKTTLAEITPQYYEGTIYCPTVSTGCFLARRNGKIFLTGNSGFPKAENIGKAVDKRNARSEEQRKQFASYLRKAIKQSGLTLKDIRIILEHKMLGGGLIPHWITEDSQPTIPTRNDWVKLKTLLSLDDTWDWIVEEAEREVTGIGRNFSLNSTSYHPNQSDNVEYLERRNPATPEAKALDGSYGGFQPKPAVEVILVAMKPLSEKTFVDQALKNRKGITWLDDGRIPHTEKPLTMNSAKNPHGYKRGSGGSYGEQYRIIARGEGRFPSHLLVSDDALDDGKVKISGERKGHNKINSFEESVSIGNGWQYTGNVCQGDSGSFSRYFDLDKWFEEKLKELPIGAQKTFPFLIIPKSSRREKNLGCENIYTLKANVSEGIVLEIKKCLDNLVAK